MDKQSGPDAKNHEYQLIGKEINDLQLETLSTVLSLYRRQCDNLLNYAESQVCFFQHQKYNLLWETVLSTFCTALIACQLVLIWMFLSEPWGRDGERPSTDLDNRYFLAKSFSMTASTLGTMINVSFGFQSIRLILGKAENLAPTAIEIRWRLHRCLASVAALILIFGGNLIEILFR
ncbi:uncharacterized protein RAG0_10641 [Rhynchosporium agropyri]|uniref:Uncharacterized protein n=1 Tax=Rhynchosporium agropyri TaxID=914238 RepID=A0A1E1L0R0_9HELO|nr:uncharacterized protein RAG0_10641 [Rhynchosporium agropyri]